MIQAGAPLILEKEISRREIRSRLDQDLGGTYLLAPLYSC